MEDEAIEPTITEEVTPAPPATDPVVTVPAAAATEGATRKRRAPPVEKRDVEEKVLIISQRRGGGYDQAVAFPPRRYCADPANAIAKARTQPWRGEACAVILNKASPPVLRCVPSDIWKILLSYVDTPSIKMFARTCKVMYMFCTPIVESRLVTYEGGVKMNTRTTDKIHLLPEQRRAYDMAVVQRRNVFITGEGGSGKTVTFRAIAEGLRNVTKLVPKYDDITQQNIAGQDDEDNDVISVAVPGNPRHKTYDLVERSLVVAIVGPTGTAADVCGGCTSASFFGNFPDHPVDASKWWPEFSSRGNDALIADMDVLQWDEVSMVSEQTLALANRKCQIVRQDKRPFGGVQLVFGGDFAQLSPVTKNNTPAGLPLRRRCILSPLWKQLFGDPLDINEERIVVLPTSVRLTAADMEFRSVLRALRCGTAPPQVMNLLNSRTYEALEAKNDPCLSLPSIILASNNATIDDINKKQLDNLLRQGRMSCTYGSWFNRATNHKLDSSESATLQLVVGGRIAISRNALGERLTNGSLGYIVDFVRLSDKAVFSWLDKCQSGKAAKKAALPEAERNRMPLFLLASDDFNIDIRTGRVISPNYEDRHPGGAAALLYPVVQFDARPDAHFIVTYWSTPVSVSQSEKDTNGSLTRFHIPLRLSYAATIHRCQGMTVNVVIRLNLRDCFAPEQVYVALSRVRSVNQIVITALPNIQRLYGQNARNAVCKDTVAVMEMMQVRLDSRSVADARRQAEIANIERGIVDKGNRYAVLVREMEARVRKMRTVNAKTNIATNNAKPRPIPIASKSYPKGTIITPATNQHN